MQASLYGPESTIFDVVAEEVMGAVPDAAEGATVASERNFTPVSTRNKLTAQVAALTR
jgi:hypothetical protein